MSANKDRPPRIVVGVDGSPSSRMALSWAVHQARLTGAIVEAVIAWQIPAELTGYGWAPVTVAEATGFEDSAKRVLEEAISDDVGSDDQEVWLQTQIVQGTPARVLLDASADADLLVLGRRGHGGFEDALLGSVSQHCVQHARCPAVIMRDDVTETAV